MPPAWDQAMFVSGNADEKAKAGKCYVKGCKNDGTRTIQYLNKKRRVCETHKNRHLPISRTK